ncbi:protein C12orf4 homolog [Actinia tenebrosa]|nr:protein C12orf4 homolog [Actinia tenebrosa]
MPEEFKAEPEAKIEESFTIHLGAQQKTMHNLRLICGDVLDMCRHKTPPGGSVFSQPHRIQTALSLYSETLAGLVLLVDNRLDSYTGIMKDFAAICQQSTEFHFPDLDKQLCLIQQSVEHRKRTKSSTSVTARVQRPTEEDALKVPTLNAGDFYITHHSNLAEAQVVFHLIVDDTVKSASLNSRNPSIVGLRHVLHTAVRYNITTLTIPLLLFHEMTDEMTVNWCVKRAELVLKCVKGFMMECASWSGVESLNVQFMIPKGISLDMFNTISNMLPNIFRISTPLDLTSTSNR